MMSWSRSSAAVLISVYLWASTAGLSAQASQAVGLFSESYHEARENFLAAAQNAGGEIVHYELPQRDINGQALFTDIALFNMDDASRVLVLGSGTHGVEGFAGSAIQLGLLREGLAENLKPGFGLLFYHALNPYGFSYLRRFNEDNVDINRNFVDHSVRHPVNEEYEFLADLMEPDSLSYWSMVKTQSSFAWYRLSKGREWLQRAISRGQYTHPKGLFYGGHSATWSNYLLRKIVAEYLSRSSEIVLIDFHTGLGEYAAAEVIVGDTADSPVQQNAREIWGDLVKSTALGESVSPPIEGALKYSFPRMLPGAKVVAVSLEFGTYSTTDIFWALWRENYLYHHPSDTDIDRAEIGASLRSAFYPNEPKWNEAVWKQGRVVVYKALEKLVNAEEASGSDEIGSELKRPD
jgi:hypothetical protein